MTDVMDAKGKRMLEKPGAEEFARRYEDLVYAAALRQVGEAQGAADVMQGVFMVMIRKEREGRLPEERFMAGWLLRVTHYVVKEMSRAERLRAMHERRAAEVRPEEAVVGAEEREAMLKQLDEALFRMRAVDREVIARRFLRSESVGEVATALGMTENTASKRIARALEKLRAGLARRGVTLGVAGITGVLTSQAIVKTPAAVAGALGADPGVVIVNVVKDVIWRLAMAKAKVVAGAVIVGIFVVGGVTLSIWTWRNPAQVEPAGSSATSRMDQGSVARSETVQNDMADDSEPTALSKRYFKIFSQLNEKNELDQGMSDLMKSSGSTGQENVRHEISEMQVAEMVSVWGHLEEAAMEVARRHGMSTDVLNAAASLPPLDHMTATTRTKKQIFQERSVIPLDDGMAKEVVDLANARYAQSKIPASQP